MRILQDVSVDGSLTGTSFIKTGGTSSQYLMADGSVGTIGGGGGNTIIGTDADISYSGATVVSTINMTDGVITSHGSRTLTLNDLGYTGATNANYITSNSQLSNGANYITSAGNTQLSTEAVQDIVGAMFIDGSNTTAVYTDANNTLKIDATSSGGTVTNVTGGTGIDVTTGTTVPNVFLDLNELTRVYTTTGMQNTDSVAIVDGTTSRAVYVDDFRRLDTATSSNTASGVIIRMTAAETITVGDALYMTSTEGRVGVAHANAGSNDPPCMGIAVTAAANGVPLDVLIHGIADFSVFPLWTVGDKVYLSDNTAGGLVTTTAPDDTGDTVQVLGIAMGADKMLFNPSYNTIVRA